MLVDCAWKLGSDLSPQTLAVQVTRRALCAPCGVRGVSKPWLSKAFATLPCRGHPISSDGNSGVLRMKLFRFSFLLAVVPLCASAATLAPTSTWAYQAQFMGEGDFFSSTYTATVNEFVTVTAWNAVSDQFGIYIDGTLQLHSSVVPDWDALGMLSAVPDQTFNSFDAVFNSGLYSTATFDVQKGDVIWIQLTDRKSVV